MPTDTNIRRFNEADLDSVHDLVHNTIDISYRPDYSEKVIKLFKEFHSRETILDDAENGCTLVASNDGEIVGTGTLLGGHIQRVFIKPSFQDHGIGTLIANELEKIAVENNVPVLDLSAALGSRTFWESRGFNVKEELFAPARKDVIIHYFAMEKTLNTAYI